MDFVIGERELELHQGGRKSVRDFIWGLIWNIVSAGMKDQVIRYRALDVV